MSGELSHVLDHIEKMNELELEGVPPTSHVVDVVNALRARRAAPVAPRAKSCSQAAPERLEGGFLVPSPGACRHERADRAHGRRSAAERVRAGELAPPSCSTPTASARGADELNAFIWVADEAPDRARLPTRPLGGVPLAVKDLFCTEGVPSQAGSRILEGYRPPYTATAVERPRRRRRAAAGQDQPGRVRDGLLERELRLRTGAQPVGPRRASPAARPAAAPPRSPPGWRRGRSAPTPAARSASPPRCAGSSG